MSTLSEIKELWDQVRPAMSILHVMMFAIIGFVLMSAVVILAIII